MRLRHLLLTTLLATTCLLAETQTWTGDFSGNIPAGIQSSARLRAAKGIISGTLTMNGKSANVSGKLKGSTSKGSLHDLETGKDYVYTASLTGNNLVMNITFPELQGQVVTLRLSKGERAAATNPPAASTSAAGHADGSHDARLLGTWRHTEVINSGSGDNFGSFSSEQYIEFLPGGKVRSWAGSAAGGSGGNSFQSSGNSNVQQGGWYTEGNLVYFEDPATKQKVATKYAVDGARMMFSNGSRNTIFEKIR